MVSVTTGRLTYEADPRHTDLLNSTLKIVSANSVATPGVKPIERDDLLVKENETCHNLNVDHDSATDAIGSEAGKGMHTLVDAHVPPQNSMNVHDALTLGD